MKEIINFDPSLFGLGGVAVCTVLCSPLLYTVGFAFAGVGNGGWTAKKEKRNENARRQSSRGRVDSNTALYAQRSERAFSVARLQKPSGRR